MSVRYDIDDCSYVQYINAENVNIENSNLTNLKFNNNTIRITIENCSNQLLNIDIDNNIESFVILNCKDIRNIDFLENCTKLKTLIVEGNKFQNINKIIKLKNLKFLELNSAGLMYAKPKLIQLLKPLRNLESVLIDNGKYTLTLEEIRE